MTQTLANRAKSSRRERRAHEHAQRRGDTHSHEPQQEADDPTFPIAWPLLLLFASGAASLIYQVLWIKQLALVVGVEVQAVTTGVSAFFAGLAIGGWIFGRLADRLARPLHLYALLEAGVLVLALASTWMLPHAAAPFASLQDRIGPLAWVLPFVLVGLPAVLMGGTLPVLMRVLCPAASHMGRSGARLYAANTAGAIAGTLAASFVLIPWLGVLGSACAAAALNAGAALVAALLGRTQQAIVPAAMSSSPAIASSPSAANSTDDVSSPAAAVQTAHDAPSPADTARATRTAKARLALVLYALAGGIALGYEVVWSQVIVQFISTRSFAFAVVLATYLLGLTLGSALASRYADRARDPWGVFAVLIVSAGLVALLEVAVLGNGLLQWQSLAREAALGATGSLLTAMCAGFAVAAVCVVFVPTLLLGAAFPFALRLNVDNQHTGRDVGAVVALNTAGGIAGTLLTGFVLVPKLGLIHTLAALAILAGAVSLIAVLRGSDVRPFARWSVPVLAVLTLVTVIVTPSDRLATLLAESRGGNLTFYEESAGGTVAVVEQNAGQRQFRRLYIQGVSNSGDTMASLRYMRLQALLPLIIHRETPRTALVIGLGTGITGGALLTWPGLEHRAVAELLPAVVRAAPQFKGNYSMNTDARMDIRMRDGRRELLRNAERYDLITLEPPPPSAAGVVNLYSSDFYRLAASRLQQGGIVAQWLPLPTQNEEDTRSLIQSFIQVFPHAALWTTELHEMMLVGSMQPLELDVPRIEARFAQPQVAAALREVGIASPAALLATWITDRAGLEYYAADAQPVTDDQPRIEYTTWVHRDAFPTTLAHLLALRTAPPLQGADETFRAAMENSRSALQSFYTAGLDAYKGDRDAWAQDIGNVLRTDPDNAYYRWLIGDGS
ncbi:fused MFS/spermidine synthase [Paraburkholderia domus]|uniref:Polyamine aminopropyltransferase n=1 Tax=Paraburkholderia domus TaxID=2793075 RepID=A0A9N8MS46_9BURK|nr:fused MFS/spermidine synthase [Paraburkholderia domus]MBK5061443.1 fused MFS/spermidine synthase [Burkholderia sp. R-70199]MBK5120235.1 fused MFS/spermidine synthase [Burkholderia sp. R-69980]MBK5165677.1 fused MFS/spermidine synthase [Burkholderia sp. R-70211]CAE6891949.1 Polyamine aminopropyltransferase [Paraburkholderia domus]CAE6893762.1 Polyamine aminopropyltransferase [Paraburkholderia domus]